MFPEGSPSIVQLVPFPLLPLCSDSDCTPCLRHLVCLGVDRDGWLRCSPVLQGAANADKPMNCAIPCRAAPSCAAGPSRLVTGAPAGRHRDIGKDAGTPTCHPAGAVPAEQGGSGCEVSLHCRPVGGMMPAQRCSCAGACRLVHLPHGRPDEGVLCLVQHTSELLCSVLLCVF